MERLKMKFYRIKFSLGWYIPQYRHKFIPFWWTWKCSSTGFDWGDMSFDNEEEARIFIQKDKEAEAEWRKTKALKTRIININ